MKRIIIFVLTAVILLSMGGCTKKKADNTVEVFCLNMDVTSSVPESYVLRSKNSDVDKQVDELLGRLQDKPEDSRLRKAIPDEVSVRGHDEKNYNCTVDFSKEYYDLTAAPEQSVLKHTAMSAFLICNRGYGRLANKLVNLPVT